MLEIINYNESYLEDIINFDKLYLTASFKEINLSSNDYILIALLDNRFVGFLYYTYIIDEIDIISICVDDKYRNQNIASNLLKKMFNNHNILNIFLEVRIDNIKAINLYKKFNFKEINIRKKYYNNQVDALIMKWSKEE